jgi:putative endonuclease
MPHFVYLLKCKDNTLYCGYTNNLEKRISTHNSGKASKYTRGRLPVKLIYVEEHSSKSSALKKEYKIKQLSKNKKKQLVKQNYKES